MFGKLRDDVAAARVAEVRALLAEAEKIADAWEQHGSDSEERAFVERSLAKAYAQTIALLQSAELTEILAKVAALEEAAKRDYSNARMNAVMYSVWSDQLDVYLDAIESEIAPGGEVPRHASPDRE